MTATHREPHIPTSLERRVASAETSEAELKRLATLAWQLRGTLVVLPGQISNWRDRALLDVIGTRLYGPKRCGE